LCSGSGEYHQISVSECDRIDPCEFMLHVQQSASGVGASKDADEQQLKLHMKCSSIPEKQMWYSELGRLSGEARDRILVERAEAAAKLTASAGPAKKSAAMMLFGGARPAPSALKNESL
jgi:hypothetical protein